MVKVDSTPEFPPVFNVYLAGKIEKNCWRSGAISQMNHKDVWPNVINWIGPHFIECDRGCAHGEHTHGQAATWKWELELRGEQYTGSVDNFICFPDTGPRRDHVHNGCLTAIRACDHMFVWATHDFHTAHGTHVEMGFAKAIGKPIWLAIDKTVPLREIKKWWFVFETAGRRRFAESAADGAQWFMQELRSNPQRKLLLAA